jgi:hypothetical protein
MELPSGCNLFITSPPPLESHLAKPTAFRNVFPKKTGLDKTFSHGKAETKTKMYDADGNVTHIFQA